MDVKRGPPISLFDVYLRLRPPHAQSSEPFVDLDTQADGHHTHITVKPPASDSRKRAVERFGFTRVFDEHAAQLDIFNGVSLLPQLEGVLAPNARAGRDGLLATLGVTGSGKSHTILGSKTQRGLIQLTLDILFQSIGSSITDSCAMFSDLTLTDRSEAQLQIATTFLESIYGDGDSRFNSRAQTPMPVSPQKSPFKLQKNPARAKTHSQIPRFQLSKIYRSLKNKAPVKDTRCPIPGEFPQDPAEELEHNEDEYHAKVQDDENDRANPFFGIANLTRNFAKALHFPSKEQPSYPTHSTPLSSKRPIPRASTIPKLPEIDSLRVASDTTSEYAIVISMYEVYNDRIFDLLTGAGVNSKSAPKDSRRRALLFKCTEDSPDKKVVAGLRKVICGCFEEALLVLETGLTERRVAGTGSNAVSSRSHGFFCIEVKKRPRGVPSSWTSATMTVVDLAGSERARAAKTAGSTLAEAGKINESLMYLGQCMQMQSDNAHLGASSDPHLVPFRQCKLTELLFSNIFTQRGAGNGARAQQRATMIVTADPRGDFNATSQILRYSALAREVTVPRIPSVTQSIIYPSLSKHEATSPVMESAASSTGRTSPTLTNNAGEEVAALQSELEILQVQLSEEVMRRKAAEASWALALAKTDEVVEAAEAAVRAECMDAFEQQLALEKARFAVARDEEREANEKLFDSKVDILREATEVDDDEPGGISIYEDSWEEKFKAVERENGLLVQRLQQMENETRRLQNQGNARSPSRKLKPLKTKRWVAEHDSMLMGSNDENELPIV
ncbi:MAG: hypothetical protein Q9162_002513 [Coniocarpon cinnabarinum]